MVADGGGNGERRQCLGAEIAGVLLLLGLAGLIDLVAGGNDEAHIGVLGQSSLQRPVPAEGVVPGRGIGSAAVSRQRLAALGLALGGADLGIAHIEHLHRGEAAGLVGLHVGLDTVFLHRVVIGGVLLQSGDGDMVVVIGHTVGQGGVHVGSLAGKGLEIVPVRTEVDHGGGSLAVVLAVPGKVQLRLVGAGGQGHLGVIRSHALPVLGPGGPFSAAAHRGTVVVVLGGSQRGNHRPYQQCTAQGTGQDSLLHFHFDPSSHLILK